MKSLKILSIMAGLLLSHLVSAQTKEINELTYGYFSIKDALVADDGKTASAQAESFVKQIEIVSKSALNASQEKVWNKHKNELLDSSNAIAKTSDISKQRAQLNELSTSLFAVLKAFKVNESKVYYQYCPMKKAFWLSSEKEIKNPYYGNKMPTCGTVKEILK